MWVHIEVDRKEAKINMRVDPLMHLSEAITSIFEAIAYPAMLVLAVMLLVLIALELRSRMRRPEMKRNDRAAARDGSRRARGDRVAPAAR